MIVYEAYKVQHLPMTNKTAKQFFFEVKLKWMASAKVILSSKHSNGVIYAGTAAEFGGDSNAWSAEDLFLGSVSACFVSTYLAFARKLNFTVTGLQCNIIGQIKVVKGKYHFTNINLFPEIYIASEVLRKKATQALEKTHQHCVIINSLNAAVIYHSQVLTGLPPENTLQNLSADRLDS